ncbi:MAG: type IV toxin-antitoxin system AbiEi family antitoxin domain-containing protein [Thermoplasmata archaeon]
MERRKVTRLEFLQLARAQVVTTGELAKILAATPSRAARLAFDLKRRGLLTRVKRGVYASVPLDADPSGFRPDPFLAVQKALGGGYTFSHQSALSLLGGEQMVRRTVEVSAPGVRSRRRHLGNLVVHIHSVPGGDLKDFTTRVRRGGARLAVTSPERTLVDLASLPNPVQDYEAVLEAFRTLLPRSEPKRVLAAARATHSAPILARVGHLLKTSVPASPEMTEVLRSIRNSLAHAGPVYFATRPRDRSNRFDREFKLVYPGAH